MACRGPQPPHYLRAHLMWSYNDCIDKFLVLIVTWSIFCQVTTCRQTTIRDTTGNVNNVHTLQHQLYKSCVDSRFYQYFKHCYTRIDYCVMYLTNSDTIKICWYCPNTDADTIETQFKVKSLVVWSILIGRVDQKQFTLLGH